MKNKIKLYQNKSVWSKTESGISRFGAACLLSGSPDLIFGAIYIPPNHHWQSLNAAPVLSTAGCDTQTKHSQNLHFITHRINIVHKS